MTSHFLLLLGAGFSRNWGGWLASEADEYLLGHSLIDKPVRDVLWRYRRTGGFEAALGELQERDRSDARLEHLQRALIDMFSHMDQAFEGITDFNFSNDRRRSIPEFLARFDAIFTLNQDLLLERHYLLHLDTANPAKWSGCQVPGLRAAEAGGSGLAWLTGTCVPDDPSTFKLRNRMQPYFKLHGSWNWLDASSGQLLVLGGNKPGTIAKQPLLKFYHEEFERRLSVQNSKLMVIGYSFRDDHINRAVLEAVRTADLKIFIIDPAGTTIIDKNWNISTANIYTPGDLVGDMWPNLVGASRRNLREIFGTDRVEFEKVVRFFG